MCCWPLRAPTPFQSLFGKCNFRDSNLVTLYLFVYLVNPLKRSSKKYLRWLITIQQKSKINAVVLMFRWTLFWAYGFVPLSNWLIFKLCFQECNAVNASLLLNLINNNFLIFLTGNLPILNPYVPPKSKNLQPHSSNSIENATPLQSLHS